MAEKALSRGDKWLVAAALIFAGPVALALWLVTGGLWLTVVVGGLVLIALDMAGVL